MDARDFRGLGRSAQEALRRRALFLIEREGMTQAQAARAVGVHRQTVNVWLRRYRERGEEGVLDGRRVSPRRGKGLLTAEEAGQARGWIADGTPDGLGLVRAMDQPGATSTTSRSAGRSPTCRALGHFGERSPFARPLPCRFHAPVACRVTGRPASRRRGAPEHVRRILSARLSKMSGYCWRNHCKATNRADAVHYG